MIVSPPKPEPYRIFVRTPKELIRDLHLCEQIALESTLPIGAAWSDLKNDHPSVQCTVRERSRALTLFTGYLGRSAPFAPLSPRQCPVLRKLCERGADMRAPNRTLEVLIVRQRRVHIEHHG